MKKALITIILPISALLADTNTTVALDKNSTTTIKAETNSTAKIKLIEKKDINGTIIKGTTIGHYQKPGAPVDMTYTTRKIKVGEVSDVNVTFSTSLKSGEMDISISFDKELKPVGEDFNRVIFPIIPGQRDYKLHLKVTSSKNGLYYVRFLIKIKDSNGISSNMRAFAVPVYVGNGRLNRKSSQQIMKAFSGENLSVSKAEETIETLDE